MNSNLHHPLMLNSSNLIHSSSQQMTIQQVASLHQQTANHNSNHQSITSLANNNLQIHGSQQPSNVQHLTNNSSCSHANQQQQNLQINNNPSSPPHTMDTTNSGRNGVLQSNDALNGLITSNGNCIFFYLKSISNHFKKK